MYSITLEGGGGLRSYGKFHNFFFFEPFPKVKPKVNSLTCCTIIKMLQHPGLTLSTPGLVVFLFKCRCFLKFSETLNILNW